jgi:hypothetical protein
VDDDDDDDAIKRFESEAKRTQPQFHYTANGFTLLREQLYSELIIDITAIIWWLIIA